MHLAAQRALGVPYTDEMVENAARDAVWTGERRHGLCRRRHPSVMARRRRSARSTALQRSVTEMDALVAYMQVLGRMTGAAYEKPLSLPNKHPSP